MDELGIAALKAKLSEYCDRLGCYSVPFLANQNNALIQCGSGVPFRLGSECFILTAWHVIKYTVPGAYRGFSGVPLFIGAGPAGTLGVSLDGRRILRADDPFDLAIVELTPDDAETIKHEASFLNLSSFDLDVDLHENAACLILGYPSEENGPDLANKTLAVRPPHGFFTTAYRFDRGDLPPDEYDKATHFVLDYVEAKMRNYDSQSDQLPDPDGISGCGIWKLNNGSSPVTYWKPDQARLIGIEHAVYRKKRVVVATQVRYVLQLLLQKRPELRPAINITFPGY